jgi:hypothetical protein
MQIKTNYRRKNAQKLKLPNIYEQTSTFCFRSDCCSLSLCAVTELTATVGTDVDDFSYLLASDSTFGKNSFSLTVTSLSVAFSSLPSFLYFFLYK